MSKKTKDEKVDLLYLNKKSKNPTNKTKNKNVPKKQKKEDIINLNDEIIIGLTPKPKEKTEKKQNTNNKANKAKQTKTRKQTKVNSKKSYKDPKKIAKRVKFFKWTSLTVVFIGAIVLFMLSPIFNVKQITVEGIEKLSKEEIISISQIKLDENTFKIRGVDVIEKIENNNYVESADIKRELPSGIKITVKERIPRYMIEIANGNAYIDSKGYILEISTEKLQMPILTGYTTSIDSIVDYENSKKLSDEDCRRIQTINEIYDSAKNNNILVYITSIDMSNMNEINLILETEGKVAHLGNASNANLRILFLKKMMEEENGKSGDAFINGDINTKKPKPYFRERV